MENPQQGDQEEHLAVHRLGLSWNGLITLELVEPDGNRRRDEDRRVCSRDRPHHHGESEVFDHAAAEDEHTSADDENRTGSQDGTRHGLVDGAVQSGVHIDVRVLVLKLADAVVNNHGVVH